MSTNKMNFLFAVHRKDCCSLNQNILDRWRSKWQKMELWQHQVGNVVQNYWFGPVDYERFVKEISLLKFDFIPEHIYFRKFAQTDLK